MKPFCMMNNIEKSSSLKQNPWTKISLEIALSWEVFPHFSSMNLKRICKPFRVFKRQSVGWKSWWSSFHIFLKFLRCHRAMNEMFPCSCFKTPSSWEFFGHEHLSLFFQEEVSSFQQNQYHFWRVSICSKFGKAPKDFWEFLWMNHFLLKII